MDLYFSPRDNKVYSYLTRRSLAYLYSLTICVVGLFIWSWFYFLYAPTVAATERYESEIRQAKNKHIMVRQAQSEFVTLEQSVAHMEELVNKHSSKDLPASVFQSHIFYVTQQLGNLGLVLNNVTLEPEQDKQWYIKNAALFELNGNLQSLLAWLEQIKNSKNMIRCNTISLHKMDDERFACSCKLTFFLPKMLVKN